MSMQMQICHLIPYVQSLVYQIPIFSSIFKKEVGISFITYLTDYRMQQAVHLMLETNEKNYEIAEHVGYEDANYFGYVFKRKYGMSPSKYRTEHMGK